MHSTCIPAAAETVSCRLAADTLDYEAGKRMRFLPVTLDNMPAVYFLLMQEKGRTTDFSFGGLAMWVDYFNYEYCIVRDTLFIKGVLEDDRSVVAFSLPVGTLPLRRAVNMLAGYCDARGLQLEFSAVPEYALEGFSQLRPRRIIELTDWGDYLYEAEKLATLSGKKMSKKRNHVNRFMSLYEGRWNFEPLTDDNCSEALAFMDIFDREGDDTRQARDERELTRRMLERFDILSEFVEGGVLRVDGKVCAFTLGDIKGDTLFIHIEKATRAVEGSYETINKLFAARMLDEHPELRYINREDDAGDEGLRLAKRSYHPVEMLRKFNIVF